MGEEQRERQREGGWENGKKGEKEAALEREREKERGELILEAEGKSACLSGGLGREWARLVP